MAFFKSMPEGSSGAFLKVKDGESVRIIVVGESQELWKSPYVMGEASVIVPAGTKDAQWKFRVNVAIVVGKEMVMKIWEGGRELGEQLEDLGDNYDIHNVVFLLTRKKKSNRVSWALMPLPDPISERTKDKIANMELHDLSEKKSKKGAIDTPFTIDESPMPNFDDEIPF